MTESATGIILRTRPLTETSVIAQWLTPQFGRLSTVAKGARRPKSPFRGQLDLFYEADFSFARSRRSELHALREVSLRATHEVLRYELGCLQQASYAAALIEQTTERETPLPEIYALLVAFLKLLAQPPPRPRNIFAFELKLLRLLGQEPDMTQTRLAPEAQTLLIALMETPLEQLGELRATAAQARAIQQFLHGFLIYHLGKLPHDRAVALGVMKSG